MKLPNKNLFNEILRLNFYPIKFIEEIFPFKNLPLKFSAINFSQQNFAL